MESKENKSLFFVNDLIPVHPNPDPANKSINYAEGSEQFET